MMSGSVSGCQEGSAGREGYKGEKGGVGVRGQGLGGGEKKNFVEVFTSEGSLAEIGLAETRSGIMVRDEDLALRSASLIMERR